MTNDVFYADKLSFESKIAQLRNGGASQLQVVTDFDFTLTKLWAESSYTISHSNASIVSAHNGDSTASSTVEVSSSTVSSSGDVRGEAERSQGTRLMSCHKVLEECGLLSEAYHARAQALQAKYYPLEVNPALDLPTKTRYMVEWVTQAHALLLEAGLSRAVLVSATRAALQSRRLLLREGAVELLRLLDELGVPVLVFSAGIADVIEEVLRLSFAPAPPRHLHVLSNRCVFGVSSSSTTTTTTAPVEEEEETLVAFEEPVLHVFNKRASSHAHCSYLRHADLHSRGHLLLLGDSVGDADMAEGIPHRAGCLLRVGFLNDRPERLPEYLALYDVVLLGDPDMRFVLDLLRSIVAPPPAAADD